MQTRIVRAGLGYFAMVFGAGFVLGAIRVPWLVPRLGVRTAELLEMPLMLAVIVLSARFIVRRHRLHGQERQALGIGLVALALLLAAELGLARLLSGQSALQYLASRDPVSGAVYLALLVVFAIAPAWLVSRARR